MQINILNSHAEVKIIAIIFFLLIETIRLNAQPSQVPGDPDLAPIDGGMSVLIAAGIAFGAKKIKKYRKKISINSFK